MKWRLRCQHPIGAHVVHSLRFPSEEQAKGALRVMRSYARTTDHACRWRIKGPVTSAAPPARTTPINVDPKRFVITTGGSRPKFYLSWATIRPVMRGGARGLAMAKRQTEAAAQNELRGWAPSTRAGLYVMDVNLVSVRFTAKRLKK